jgi:hypothetical protein
MYRAGKELSWVADAVERLPREPRLKDDTRIVAEVVRALVVGAEIRT